MTDQKLQEIKKQLEFYFGNANLPKDTFLRGLVAQDPQGYVEINQLCLFNRMKNLGATIALVAQAAELNKEMFQLSPDRTRVRRIMPLPEIDDSVERTVVLKGLPVDVKLEDLEKTFASYNPESIRLIRKFAKEDLQAVTEAKEKGTPAPPLKRKFLGTVHVLLRSIEDAIKFETEVTQYGDKNIERINLKTHVRQKKEARAQRKRDREQKKLEDEIAERIKLITGTLFQVKIPKTSEPLNFVSFKKLLGDILGVERPKIFIDMNQEEGTAQVRIGAIDLLEKWMEMKDKLAYEGQSMEVKAITDPAELRKAAVTYVQSQQKPGRPNKKKRFNNHRR